MKIKHYFFILLLFILLSFSAISQNQKPGINKEFLKTDLKKVSEVKLMQDINFGKLPLYFIENRGQVNKKALYYVKAKGYTLWATRTGIVFDCVKMEKIKKRDFKTINRDKPDKNVKIERDVQELIFIGANLKPKLFGKNKTEYRVNYFMGRDKSKWKRDISTYSSIVYKNLYKGIDLRVYGKERLIEYDWEISPGASPEKIVFKYRGVKSHINKDGDIVVEGKFGKIKHKRPVSVQDGKKIDVSFKKLGKNLYGFKVGEYDKKKPLIIDPLVLVYSTYLGGSGYDLGRGIAVDSSGAPYVTGETYSSDFPLKNFYQGTNVGSFDAFVTKLSSSGNTLIYSTYIGGSDYEWPSEIAVDSSGSAYVTGSTYSPDFPVQNPYQGIHAGGTGDVFVTKLSSSGNDLIYSTYLGGADIDWVEGIAVDSSGAAYITGYTDSSDFPIKNPFQGNNAGSYDAFVTKLSGSGDSLIYSTYLGGTEPDIAKGIAVDSSGAAYVTGSTTSSDFPVKNPFRGIHAGESDAFVTKFSSTGKALIYSTYLGGSYSDFAYGIVVDLSGATYITGYTSSSDYPIENPYQGTNVGGVIDVFVTKLSGSGDSLIYSTYLGGTEPDIAKGIAVDSSGAAYVTGSTTSSDFPVKSPYRGSISGNGDAFVTKLSGSGKTLIYSTYLGGSDSELAYGIAVDSFGSAYITGYTKSSDFPIKNPYQGIYMGSREAFVTKLAIVFTVKASVSGGNGSVSPAKQTVNKGDNATIYITPDTGYEIDLIMDNGVSQPIANPYVIKNVNDSHNVVVKFKHIYYPPTLSLTGERKTEKAWLISKDYAVLNITIEEAAQYPMPVSKYSLYREDKNGLKEIKIYPGPEVSIYYDKYITKYGIVRYKLIAYGKDGSIIKQVEISL